MPFPHAKLQGEWAEALFVAECLRRGLVCAKPFGDSVPYDFIVDSPNHEVAESPSSRLRRVQVKSVSTFESPAGIYYVAVKRTPNKTAYRPGDFDLLAAYLITCDMWYIIPGHEVIGRKTISFRPQYKNHHRRLEKYRGAWHLLTEANCLKPVASG